MNNSKSNLLVKNAQELKAQKQQEEQFKAMQRMQIAQEIMDIRYSLLSAMEKNGINLEFFDTLFDWIVKVPESMKIRCNVLCGISMSKMAVLEQCSPLIAKSEVYLEYVLGKKEEDVLEEK